MGAKLLAGLPESHSLTSEFIEKYLAGRPGDLVAVIVLHPKKKTIDLESSENEDQAVFRIAALEHYEDIDARDLLEQLRARHRERTGENVLPGMDVLPDDGDPSEDESATVPGATTGDPSEYEQQVAAARELAAAEARQQALEADTKEEAAALEKQADEFADGKRDDELAAHMPSFSDAAAAPEPAKPAKRARRGRHLNPAE